MAGGAHDFDNLGGSVGRDPETKIHGPLEALAAGGIGVGLGPLDPAPDGAQEIGEAAALPPASRRDSRFTAAGAWFSQAILSSLSAAAAGVERSTAFSSDKAAAPSQATAPTHVHSSIALLSAAIPRLTPDALRGSRRERRLIRSQLIRSS